MSYAANTDGTSATQTINSDGSSEISVTGIVGQSYVSEDTRYDDIGNTKYQLYGFQNGSSEEKDYSLDYSSGESYLSSDGFYDSTGLLISETDFYYDGSVYQNKSQTRGDDGSLTTTTMDPSGRVTQTETVDGSITTDTYFYPGNTFVDVKVAAGGSYSSAADNLYVETDQGTTLTLTGADDTVYADSDQNAIEIGGANAQVTSTGGILRLDQTASAFLSGDNNIINMQDSTNLSLNGSNEAINVIGANATIAGQSSSTSIQAGVGSSIDLVGSGNIFKFGAHIGSATISDYDPTTRFNSAKIFSLAGRIS